MNTIYVIILVVLLAVAGAMGYRTWTLGDSSEDYDIVCISGHEYWRANFSNKGFLGINLTDDGKPINCAVVDK